jgi:cytochrome c biogenesis protein CcdA/thiol-disulfide isomerase/thioredoxin
MPSAATFALAFIGGTLTILSPCVLPVIPLLFGGAGRSFRRSTLPMLLGLAVTFTVVVSTATVTAAWLTAADVAGRWVALILLGAVGISLCSDHVATWMARPAVMLGARLHRLAGRPRGAKSAAVGAAAGLLWAPCAGPILGLVIATAAAGGVGVHTTVLFFTFALGAAAALGAVLFLGGRMLDIVRTVGPADRWIRRAAGVAVVTGVVAMALGADRTLLAQGAFAQTTGLEKALVGRLARGAPAAPAPGSPGALGARVGRVSASSVIPDALAPRDEGLMHAFPGATKWLNSAALTPASLRGKVVLVEFWTFECINCLHALPHVKALYDKYRDRGFVIVGVHTPELAAERVVSNVQQQVHDLGITFPVVIDNGYSIWNAWHNEYWPALYFIDVHGRIRYHRFGEGAYDEEDRVVQQLLYEAGQ